jgi:hypothetical protein
MWLRCGAEENPMDNFISEDDLLTFEGWLKYQAVSETSTTEKLKVWRNLFEEAMGCRKTSPKVGLMKFVRFADEQKYAVAIRDGPDLWLTLWVRYSPRGEIFIMSPGGNRRGNAHASYHLNGNFHQKSHGDTPRMRQRRQPLRAAFKGSEHLGLYGGHGTKSIGAVCDPKAFDGVVIVEPGILGPHSGSVGVDLVEPGYELEWNQDMGQRFYLSSVHHRQVFRRNGRPSVVITIQR